MSEPVCPEHKSPCASKDGLHLLVGVHHWHLLDPEGPNTLENTCWWYELPAGGLPLGPTHMKARGVQTLF